jgi:hypothetical protein
LQKREQNMYRRLNYLGARRQLRSYGAASQVPDRSTFSRRWVRGRQPCVLSFMVGGRVCHVRVSGVCAAPAAACAAAAVHAELSAESCGS